MSREPSPRWAWLTAAIGLLLYAFLYDNATSLPTAMGYGWTRLTPLPRQVRLLETAVIGALLLAALAHRISRPTRTLVLGSLLFVGLGLTSYVHSSSVAAIDGTRLLYMYLLPLFVFIIALETPWKTDPWRPAAITVLAWVIASAAVSWFQFAWLGYPLGDDITGLAKDAHANGTLMMLVAIHLAALGLFLGERRALLAAPAFLLTMVLCSVLKVMVFGVAALAVLVWAYLRGQPRAALVFTRRILQGLAVAAAAIAVIATVFARIDAQNAERLAGLAAKLRQNPTALGPLQAHEYAALKVARDLPTLVLGLGPFRFANPISVGQVLEDAPLGKMANTEVLAVADEHGDDTRITLTSSLLAELGWPAFLIVVLMYLAVWRAVWRACRSAEVEIRARAAACLACGTILALTALCSVFGSIELLSVSWPVMLLSGFVCRMNGPAAAQPA